MSKSLESSQSKGDSERNTEEEHIILETEVSQELIAPNEDLTDPTSVFNIEQQSVEEAQSRQGKIERIREMLQINTGQTNNPESPVDVGTQVETTKDVAAKTVENGAGKPKSFRARLEDGFKSFLLKLETIFERKNSETNIRYRHDRYYRCIGKGGYEDFIKTGKIRSRNSRKYADVSFNIGEPAPLYLAKDPSYILEATENAAQFKPKINFYDPKQREMHEIPYRGCDPNEITNTSPIRVFEQVSPGVYRVVFDNIHDEALIEEAESRE